MKKLARVFFVALLSVFLLGSCADEGVEPIQELPVDVEAGGDDDEPGGQPGGGGCFGC